MLRGTFCATGVLLAALAAPAAAQDAEEPPESVSASLSLSTDYVFRGISQTQEEPRLRGDLSWTHDSGFYAGVWSTNSHFGGRGNTIEIDPYVGYAGTLGDSGVEFDVGYWFYHFPGAVADYDFAEVYAIVSRAFGRFGLEGSLWYSTNYFGTDFFDGSESLAYEAVLSYEIGNGFSISTTIGEQRLDEPVGVPKQDYVYYDVTLTKTWKGFTFSLAGHDSDDVQPELAAANLADSRIVAGIEIGF